MTIEGGDYSHCDPPAPVRHKKKVPFEPTIDPPAGLRSRLTRIAQLDAELDRFVLKAEDYRDLVEEAWASNFHASTSLEGNPLDEPEVRRLTGDTLRDERAPYSDDPSIQEILNHLFSWISPGLFEPPWSVPFIQDVHAFLLDGVDPSAKPGELSERKNQITNEHDQAIFIGAPPEHIAEELAALVNWMNGEGQAYDPLVTATVFFHEFESIHPFKAGNGRTGRLLFHLYLQNAGLPNSHLCTIERALTTHRELYYRLLAWADHTGSYRDLLDYFSKAVLASYEDALDRFRTEDLISSDMDETKKRLIQVAKAEDQWFQAATASDWVDGVVHDTVRRHLNELVDEGVLETTGRTRAKRYRFRNPFRSFREDHRDALAHIERRLLASKRRTIETG